MSIKKLMLMMVTLLLGFGLCRAAKFRFQDKEQAIRDACSAELKKLGITQAAAKAKYPTPEIHMASSGCLMPGETGEIVVKGKFSPGTKFVLQNDNMEVVKESLTAGEYRATVKVAPGIGPQTAAIMAISPLTGVTARFDNAAMVGGRYEWTMDASNGWRVLAKPSGGACGGSSSDGYPYEMTFFRKGETTPFEKRAAKLYYSLWETSNYRFAISQEDSAAATQQNDMQALMRQMMDPKLTDAQRQQAIQKMQKLQEEMTKNLPKMGDRAQMEKYVQQQQQQRLQFGCERIEAALAGGGFKGEMRCSEKVGTRLALTGTMKFLGR